MEKKIVRQIEICIGFLLTLMVIFLSLQIIARYIFRGSFMWSGEMSVWLFVWVSLLGSVVLCIRKKLVAVEMLSLFLPLKVQQKMVYVLTIINTVIVCLFFIFVFYYSLPVVVSYSNQTATSLGISKFYLFVPLPAASALIAGHLIVTLIRALRRR